MKLSPFGPIGNYLIAISPDGDVTRINRTIANERTPRKRNGRLKEISPRLKNLILPSILILLIGVVILSSVVTGFPFSRLKSLWIARGGEYDRNSVVAELHYYYNHPGERAVIVEAHGKTVTLNFLEENLKSVRRGFFARHRDDFSRFYDAGFDTMIIEAKKEGGGMGKIEYDLTYYRFR